MFKRDKEALEKEERDQVTQIIPPHRVTNINNQWTKMVGRIRRGGSTEMQTNNRRRDLWLCFMLIVTGVAKFEQMKACWKSEWERDRRVRAGTIIGWSCHLCLSSETLAVQNGRTRQHRLTSLLIYFLLNLMNYSTRLSPELQNAL